MALLSGTSLLHCLISEPLSQLEDMLDRLQLRQENLQAASRQPPGLPPGQPPRQSPGQGVLVAARGCSQGPPSIGWKPGVPPC